jgi:hypothetical protein
MAQPAWKICVNLIETATVDNEIVRYNVQTTARFVVPILAVIELAQDDGMEPWPRDERM